MRSAVAAGAGFSSAMINGDDNDNSSREGFS
jgi:hypothetical protein